MQITITGHHVEVTPALRAYVTEKMQKLTRHFDQITSVNVILNVEKLQHQAEATVQAGRRQIFAAEKATDMYASIDLLLDKLDQVVTDLGFAAYTAQKGGTLNMFLLTMSLMIGTAGLPHVIIRFFTVPKVADARTSAGWALVFIAILYTTAPAVGAMARLNLIDTIQTGEIGSAQGNLSYEERPQWFRNWEKTGLLAFEDKNGDGRIQYYNDGNAEFAAKAEAWGWKGNEMVTVDRDIMVLANPEIANLPNWVIALVAAGGLAAALSTAAGLLLAISSAIFLPIARRNRSAPPRL